jgi:hypothetical protein
MVDTEQKTALILQNCLDAIQSGDETIDIVLKRYPELEDELRPQLENAIWLAAHQPLLDPNPQFIKQSRQRLVSRIQYEQSKAAATQPSLKTSLLSLFRMPPVMLRAAVTLMMIFVLLIGADRVVETTATAIPGDPGYTVKRSMEDLTLAVSNDPGQQVVLHLEFSQRRLTEVNTLVNKARYTDATQTLDEFEEQVRSAVVSLDSVRDEDTVHKELLAMTVQEKLSDHSKQLSSLLPKVPSASKSAVSEALMVSSDGQVVAQTAIKRLMTMHTPQPANQQSTSTAVPQPTNPDILPTEQGIFVPFETPTEEYKQIYSSTTAPDPTQASGAKPTFPPLGPTATPFPTSPPDEIPTTAPIDTYPTETPYVPPEPTAIPTSNPPPSSSAVPAVPSDTPGLNSAQPSASPGPPPLNTPSPGTSPSASGSGTSTNIPSTPGTSVPGLSFTGTPLVGATALPPSAPTTAESTPQATDTPVPSESVNTSSTAVQSTPVPDTSVPSTPVPNTAVPNTLIQSTPGPAAQEMHTSNPPAATFTPAHPRRARKTPPIPTR